MENKWSKLFRDPPIKQLPLTKFAQLNVDELFSEVIFDFFELKNSENDVVDRLDAQEPPICTFPEILSLFRFQILHAGDEDGRVREKVSFFIEEFGQLHHDKIPFFLG